MSNIKISDLTPDNKNYNKGSEFGNSLIEKSLRKFGAGRSILIDKNNRIIAGNKTIENAGAIGLDDIIVVETTGNQIVAVKRMDIDLDSKQGRELALADNASAKANINWDFETINFDWNETEIKEWGLEIPDFEVLEAEEDDFAVPDGGTETDIVLGDLFEIGEHRLLCGSSTNADDVVKLMNSTKANMVFTDPPYGVSYVGGVIHGNKINTTHKREMLKNDEVDVYADFISLLPLVIDNGALYIFYATRNSYELFKPLKENGIDIMAVLAWIKINTGYADMNSHYKNRYEPFVYCKIGQKTNFIGATTENTTWEIEKDRDNKLHPTQKPISIPSRAISNHDAQIIADLFSGSGSTMVAAHQLKRKCFGMELDPKYCQVIVDRMLKLDPSLTIKRNGEIWQKKI
jgi:DNA modification methylase